MALLLVLSVMVCVLCLRLAEGLQVGALVTIHQKDVSSVFFEEELFGVYNTTLNNILTINVVIDSARLVNIRNNSAILSLSIIHPDYDVVIRSEFNRINNRIKWNATLNNKMDIFFNEFREWWEYELFLDFLLIEYSDILSKSILGETIQGRSIPIITITDVNDNNLVNSDKPGFYIQAAVHSNEWLANAATVYILKAICDGYYNNDNQIVNLLKNVNIFIVPTVNIDGYIYTWIGSQERNWRKNRRNNGDGSFGVDLNRNYGPDEIWGTTGASHNPSSNTYCGTAPFSESETKAISEFIFNTNYNIKAAVDMHTTGPYILWPWGYTVQPLPQPYYNQYFELGARMQAAADAVHGQNYRSIQSGTWYEASGAMEDYVCWVSDQQVLGFTFEGRSIGSGAPPIVDAGQEQLAALLVLAEDLI